MVIPGTVAFHKEQSNQAVNMHYRKPQLATSLTDTSYSHQLKVQLLKITDIENFCTHCFELESMIDESSSQGLAELFPSLLAVIFGYGGYPGWRLKNCVEKSTMNHVFEKVFLFMGAGGKLFKIIERLLLETTKKFHFPVDCLPEKVRLDLNNGIIAPFYQDKIAVAMSGQVAPQLDLNALEYYLFLFAYYIVRPTTNKDKNNWSRHNDNLYHTVFESYLNHFLPTDGSDILLQKPSVSHDLNRESLISRPGGCNKHGPIPELAVFRPGTNILASSFASNVGRRETWRSETFIQIHCEFWLNHQKASSPISFSRIAQEYSMPSEAHVIGVRMLVKHCHAFVNSSKITLQPISQLYGVTESHTEELKQSILPVFMQKGLYNFLKSAFGYWPLDPSFKFVLETWLSFIQPWRYTAGSYHNEAPEDQNIDLAVWKNFISENMLFYTTFTRMFMTRALRFDLRSVFDSHQLHRVLKVLSQANLMEILKEVDQEYSNSDNADSIHSLNGPHQLSSSYFGFQNVSPNTMLEEARYSYKSFFDEQVIHQCKELATKISDTIRKEELRKNRERRRKRYEGLLSRIKSLFNYDHTAEVHEERLIEHLRLSYTNLVTVFRLPLPSTAPGRCINSDSEFQNGLPRPRLFSDTSEDDQRYPEHQLIDGNVALTSKGRSQVINGLKRFTIQYQGDDELQPIRSYEIPYLVRSFFTLSTTINEKFKDELGTVYHGKDPVSALLRSFAVKPDKSLSFDSGAQQDLEPRISFRFLASHYTLGYFLWIIILLRLIGVGLVGILILVTLLLFFAVAKNVRLSKARSKQE